MSLTFEVISAMKSPYQLSGNTLLGRTHSISYYSSVVTISLCLSQSWTWVQFSKSNPIHMTDRRHVYKIIRMTFICKVKTPMRHCSSITHIT